MDEKGEFKLNGNQGLGIVLGKYRIAVHQWEKAAPGVKGKDVVNGKQDALKKKFDEKDSRIVRDITASSATLDIDISKPEG